MNVFSGNSNYPPGLSDSTPDAPWNQYDQDPIDVDVDYSVVMMKTTTIETSDYDVETYEECERDDEGYIVGFSGKDYTYDNVDWKEEFKNQCLSPMELISTLEEICTKLLNGEEVNIRKEKLKFIISECKDWDCDEEDVSKA